MQVQHTPAEAERKTISSPILDRREISEAERSTRKSTFAAWDAKIREVLDHGSRNAGCSRQELCDRMEDFTGQVISIHTFNAWIAPGKERARFPVVLVSAFCRATGDDRLKRLLLGEELCGLLELGERAAAILNESTRRRVLKVRGNGNPAREKRNGRCVA